ncbi:MAG: hypothetical protein WBA59_03700 [Moheibacter sp.]
MIYNAEIESDRKRATERFNWLIENNKMFELTQKKPVISRSQSNYLHLILGWFAIEYGDTLDYCKQEVFKKEVNPNIFRTEFLNRKTGELREDWRSINDLDTAEMTTAIERFRNYSSRDFGLYLPEPNEEEHLAEIEKQMENFKQWI